MQPPSARAQPPYMPLSTVAGSRRPHRDGETPPNWGQHRSARHAQPRGRNDGSLPVGRAAPYNRSCTGRCTRLGGSGVRELLQATCPEAQRAEARRALLGQQRSRLRSSEDDGQAERRTATGPPAGVRRERGPRGAGCEEYGVAMVHARDASECTAMGPPLHCFLGPCSFPSMYPASGALPRHRRLRKSRAGNSAPWLLRGEVTPQTASRSWGLSQPQKGRRGRTAIHSPLSWRTAAIRLRMDAGCGGRRE